MSHDKSNQVGRKLQGALTAPRCSASLGGRRTVGCWLSQGNEFAGIIQETALDGVSPKALYQARFRRDYSEKKGTAFEAWFVELACRALGTDFEPVAAHGRDGDFKCDGRRCTTRTVYQCYAPRQMNQAKTIAKINKDFNGALSYWHTWMREWTLVHNSIDGLPPRVVQHLDQLRNRHPDITITVWDHRQLEGELFSKLDSIGWEAVFGAAPSADRMDEVVFDDIVPVIEALERETPHAITNAIEPPSPRKLQRNALSEDVAILLEAGRRKEALVERYFARHPSPELGEKIAAAFRCRYAELVALPLPPDDIFTRLQQYAGGTGSVKQQTAALAVLSYYFERCDIFEDTERP